MEINDIIDELVKKYGHAMEVHRKHLKDFKGKIVEYNELPRHVQNEIEVLKENNKSKNAPVIDNVSAVLIVKKGGKIIAKFYGENRMATPREMIGMRRWYPEHVKSVHAEYDAVLNFVDWYLWKEPTKGKWYDFELVVVRNGGNLPSRPCAYCRAMLSDILGSVTVYFPLDGKKYGLETIGF